MGLELFIANARSFARLAAERFSTWHVERAEFARFPTAQWPPSIEPRCSSRSIRPSVRRHAKVHLVKRLARGANPFKSTRIRLLPQEAMSCNEIDLSFSGILQVLWRLFVVFLLPPPASPVLPVFVYGLLDDVVNVLIVVALVALAHDGGHAERGRGSIGRKLHHSGKNAKYKRPRSLGSGGTRKGHLLLLDRTSTEHISPVGRRKGQVQVGGSLFPNCVVFSNANHQFSCNALERMRHKAAFNIIKVSLYRRHRDAYKGNLAMATFSQRVHSTQALHLPSASVLSQSRLVVESLRNEAYLALLIHPVTTKSTAD